MSKILAWLAGTRVGRWIVGLGAVAAAAAMLAYTMFLKGKHAQAKADDAKQAREQANAVQQVIKAANLRKDVENEVETLPDAPAQPVASADPATAAGQLRDDGWVRPASPDDH